MNDNTQHALQQEEYHKLTLWERVSYDFGDFANNLTFGTVGGFLLLYMTTVNAISLGIASVIFAVVRIINVIWDPMVGTFIDKHTSKSGKYRPWILRAGIPLMIFALLLFAPFPFVKGNVAWAFIIYFVMDLTYSVVTLWLSQRFIDPRCRIC